MRYLYGDLTEFPLQENTLEMVSRFVETAAALLALHHQIDRLEASIAADRQFCEDSLADVAKLQVRLNRSFDQAMEGRPAEDVVSILARGAAEQVREYLDDGRARLRAKVEERVARTQAKIDARNAESLEHLSRFYVRHAPPMTSQALHCELREGRYHARADVLDAIGARGTYTLDAAGAGFLGAPRRLADLVPGRHELPVDTKRGWLKKEPVVQLARLDDATLVEVRDDAETAELSLAYRTPGNLGTGLRVRLTKGDEATLAVVRLEAGGAAVPVPDDLLQDEHRALLRQVGDVLADHVAALYESRTALEDLALGEDAVLGARRVPDLVRRLVKHLAPTVREIDRRSPAPEELCLKVEREGGRREEVYVPKAQLREHLAELPAELAELFEPLGLAATEATPPPRRERTTLDSDLVPVASERRDTLEVDIDVDDFDVDVDLDEEESADEG